MLGSENEQILSKLLPYQVGHTLQLYECLNVRNRVLDASDTGTGKTYCGVAVSKMLNKRPFIICPKSVITNWMDVCEFYKIKPLGIANYEMIKNGNYYTEDLEPYKCPYVEIVELTPELVKDQEIAQIYDIYNDEKTIKKELEKLEKKSSKKAEKKSSTPIKKPSNKTPKKQVDDDDENTDLEDLDDDNDTNESDYIDSDKSLKREKKDKKEFEYIFNLPDDTLVIFDEAHRCKNWSSATSKLLLGINKNKVKIMMLSATITDKIDCFKPFGPIFGFYKAPQLYGKWIKNEMKNKKYIDMEQNESKLKIIHNKIFPNYGSRLKISELGDLFPHNNIMANSYYLQNYEEVDKLYKEINDALKELKYAETRSQALGKIIKARQKIELLKVPLFIDLAKEGLDNNNSIAIFVNYRDTMDQIAEHLKTNCMVFGGQTIEERDTHIKNFQNNKEKVIILMIQAGGVGLSLHDIHGGHQRMSIISPTWSGQDMKQVFGRIHRAGSKTPAIQKIVYVAKTYEDEICKIIKNKIKTIDAINNGDLAGPSIPNHHLVEIVGEDDNDDNKKKYKLSKTTEL